MGLNIDFYSKGKHRLHRFEESVLKTYEPSEKETIAERRKLYGQVCTSFCCREGPFKM